MKTRPSFHSMLISVLRVVWWLPSYKQKKIRQTWKEKKLYRIHGNFKSSKLSWWWNWLVSESTSLIPGESRPRVSYLLFPTVRLVSLPRCFSSCVEYDCDKLLRWAININMWELQFMNAREGQCITIQATISAKQVADPYNSKRWLGLLVQID